MVHLFLGVWDIPVSEYVIFYLLIGVGGFVLGFISRYTLIVTLGIIGWFAVRDFKEFYQWQINPSNEYVLYVSISILFAVAASIGGFLLRRRVKASPLKLSS